MQVVGGDEGIREWIGARSRLRAGAAGRGAAAILLLGPRRIATTVGVVLRDRARV
jgi:hypothetical protein